jgi:O-antigen/teichoic acid export membrane protein
MTETDGRESTPNTEWAGQDDTVVRGTALNFAAKLSGGVLTGVLTVFLARKLGSSAYGVFALALSVEAILALVSDFGVIQALQRFVAEHRHDQDAVRDIVGDGIRLKLLGSLVVGAALIACAPLIADLYGAPALTWPLRAIALVLLGKNLLLMGAGVFTAIRHQVLTLMAFFLESAVEVTASIALVLIAGGATAAAFGRAIGYLCGGAFAVVLTFRLLGRGPFQNLMHPRRHLRRIAGDAGALFIVDGAYTTFDQIDSLLIGAFLSVTAVGIWQAPLRLVVLLIYPGQAIASAVAPRMARALNHEPEAETFATAVRVLLILMAAVIAVTTVWATPIITLLLGSSFHGSAKVLRALAPYVFLAGIGPLVTVGMNYIGAAGRRIPIALATTTINVVIDVILIPRIGVLGGAVGTDVAYLLYVPAHFLYCQRTLNVPIRPLAITLVRSLMAAGVMALILAAFGTGHLSILELLAGGALGLIGFATALLITREVSLEQVGGLYAEATSRFRTPARGAKPREIESQPVGLRKRARDSSPQGSEPRPPRAGDGPSEQFEDGRSEDDQLPAPPAGARAEIWRRGISADADVSDADIQYLATSFGLPEGEIERCCEAAARDARAEGVRLGLPHLAHALQRQYLGSLPDEEKRLALAKLRRRAGHPDADPPAGHVSDAKARRVSARAVLSRLARRGPALLVVVGASVAAAALGFTLARGSGDAPTPAKLDKQASAGPVRISFPSDWRRQSVPEGYITSLSNQLAVGPGPPHQRMLVVGSAPTQDPTLLPRSLLARLKSVPRPQMITLGGMKFFRYSNLSLDGAGRSESIYTLPTTIGTILGVCSMPSTHRGFAAECERVLATLKLASGTPVVPGPSPVYASSLNRALATLDAVRRRAGTRLNIARTPAAVTQAAGELASAHDAAASTVARLNAGSAAGANAALAKALSLTGAAYSDLRRAAARGDRAAYRRAASALRGAGGAVQSALAELSSFGYRFG